MDKREKILSILTDGKWRKGELFIGNPSLTNIADAILEAVALDEPAEPKRNWLKVDTDTPKGTLAVNMDNGNPLAIDTIKNVYPYGSIRFDNLGRSDKAERFIGIHLLDNPGLDAPPCEGLVLVISSDSVEPRIDVDQASEYTWGLDFFGKITQWAPVKWVDGKLVVDIDRLRGES